MNTLKLKLILVIVLVCFSCSNPDDFGFESTEFVYSDQKWELVRMTGNFVGSETTGDAMDWQEYYILSPQGTFIKSRTRNDMVTEAIGTFEIVEFETDPEHYVFLTFETGLDLVGNCGEGANELLMYRSPTILSSTWQACDGPGLDYRLVN